MAKFEREGFCPANRIRQEVLIHEDNSLIGKINETIGDRLGFMVYEDHTNSLGGDFCTELFRDHIMALRVATVLKCLIRRCLYPVEGAKIKISDITNPKSVSGISYNDGWLSSSSEDIILTNARFVVIIRTENEDVHMYIYKSDA